MRTDTQEYKLVQLNSRDLVDLKTRLRACLGLTFIFGEIRPFKINPSFEDQFGPKERSFWRLFKQYQGVIRKFELRVGYPKKCGYMEAPFWITVRIAENEHHFKPSKKYPTITLHNIDRGPRWGDHCSFDHFCNFMEQEWNLELTERQLKFNVFHEYTQTISNKKLRSLTEANMRTHNYDAALSNAGTMIESELREACISAGNNQAKGQTGDNLAVTAYGEANGCLTPPWDIATQACKGTQLLFQGFFAYIRNAYNHHAVVMGGSRDNIVEFLKGCEFLLNIIDHSSPRK